MRSSPNLSWGRRNVQTNLGSGHFDGKPSNNCQPDNLVARPASSAQIPILMIYTQNDTFWRPALSEWLYGTWTESGGDRRKPLEATRLLRVGLQVLAGARIRNSYDLISHVVLCGMSIANEPEGSPAGVGLVMHLNGSRPVIPAYLPVPPVMMWVPQSISGCDLSRSRVSNVENTISPSLSVSWQAPSMYFFPAESMLTAVHFAFILSSIFSPFMFSVGPTASSTVALPTFGTSMLDNG